MSALPALSTIADDQHVEDRPRRYPLRVRATIMIGSAAGLWALVGLAGWFLYRVIT